MKLELFRSTRLENSSEELRALHTQRFRARAECVGIPTGLFCENVRRVDIWALKWLEKNKPPANVAKNRQARPKEEGNYWNQEAICGDNTVVSLRVMRPVRHLPFSK